jgi:hypothetical protein
LRCGDLGEFGGRNRAITRRRASGGRVRSTRPRCSRTGRSRPSWRNISRFLAWRAIHWTIRSQRRLALEFRVQQANASLVVRSGSTSRGPPKDRSSAIGGRRARRFHCGRSDACSLRGALETRPRRTLIQLMREHVRSNSPSCWIALDAYGNKHAFSLTIHGDLCENFRAYWREIGMNAGLSGSG